MHVDPSGRTAISFVDFSIGTYCCIPRSPCGREEGEAEWEEKEDEKENDSGDDVFVICVRSFFWFGYICSRQVDGSKFTKGVFGSADPGLSVVDLPHGQCLAYSPDSFLFALLLLFTAPLLAHTPFAWYPLRPFPLLSEHGLSPFLRSLVGLSQLSKFLPRLLRLA